MSQSQSNLVQGIRYGWACLLARSQTIILFQYLIISLRKKLYLSTHISHTIDWKPPNQAFVVFTAEELNLHLSPTIKSGNRVGLHLQLQSSLDSLCFDFIWNTSTGSTQSSKWVSPTLSMSAFTRQLLSWKMTPGNEFRVGNKTLWKTCPWFEHIKILHSGNNTYAHSVRTFWPIHCGLPKYYATCSDTQLLVVSSMPPKASPSLCVSPFRFARVSIWFDLNNLSQHKQR